MKKRFFSLLAFLAFCCLIFVTADQYSWGIRHRMNSVRNIPVRHMKFYWRDETRNITLKYREMNIAGSLWETGTDRLRPGIILLHGSTPLGKKLGLYPLLAHSLFHKGYVVLCIDLPGFGDSDDPPDLSASRMLDDSPVVKEAVSYMTSLPSVDRNSIFLVGHSFGANVAMETATEDRRVRKVIAIGPPRRLLERAEREMEAFRRRYSKDRHLEHLVPPKVFSECICHMALENFIPWFSSDGHQPILFIDGSQEDRADLQYLKAYYEKLTPPKKYVTVPNTVPNTAHYLSVADFWGFNPVVYNHALIGDVVDLMDQWFQEG